MIPLEVSGLLAVVAVCDRKSVASPWWRCHTNNNNGTVAVGRGFKFEPPQI
jgi:hypothetical protein